MKCMHCGAQLDKSDILCLRCGTPVLTEDDISLMPNAVTTRFINEVHSNTGSLENDFSLHGSDTLHVDHVLPVVPAEPKITAQPGDPVQPRVSAQPRVSVQPRVSARQKNGVQYEDQLYEVQPKGGNIKAVLITIAVAFAVITGIFLFIILRPTDAQRDGADPSLSASGAEDSTGTGITAGSQPATMIYVYIDGLMQTDFHTMVGETVLLRARIEPEGIEGNIVWTSSDPLVLEVAQLDQRGLEASITGIAAGVEDLYVRVGDFEVSFTVFIDNQPMHLQLANAIDSNNTPIWLTITFNNGSNDGDVISFERDIDRNIWLMEDSTDQIEVDPLFSRDGNALTMRFRGPAGVFSTEVFYFYANGSGHITSPQSGSEERLSWWFITYMIEPEG